MRVELENGSTCRFKKDKCMLMHDNACLFMLMRTSIYADLCLLMFMLAC